MAAPNAQNPADFATADKQKVMGEQHINSAFFSISEMFKFVSAITIPIGMAMVVPALVAKISAEGAAGIVAGLLASPPGLVFLGVAALSTTVAISAHYIANRHYHSANFDALEVNAKHTAKYIAKELQKEAACITHEHPQNQRADGRQWTQVVNTQQPADQQHVR